MSSILARASSAYRTATKRYAPALFLRSLLRRETRRIQAMAQIENAPFETERQRLLTVDAKAGDEPIESGSIETLVGGSLRTIRREEQRRHLLNPVIEEIDKLLADNRSISIYEPGCGHAYNLILLKNRYGDRVTLAGSDFSKSRLAAAQRHFGPKLNGINLTVRSLNETAAVTEHYDMIFTVGALLFTGTNVDRSVRQLCEMTKRRLVLVEPTWEYALAHQRLYLLRAGYSVSILPAVKDTGLPIVRSESASCDFSIMLPASVIVVDCEQKGGDAGMASYP